MRNTTVAEHEYYTIVQNESHYNTIKKHFKDKGYTDNVVPYPDLMEHCKASDGTPVIFYDLVNRNIGYDTLRYAESNRHYIYKRKDITCLLPEELFEL